MEYQETKSFFTELVNWYENEHISPSPNNEQVRAYKVAIEAFDKIQKIKDITERALRSEDPINLYKARALDEIAKILDIKLEAPAEESDSKDQITFDDIL